MRSLSQIAMARLYGVCSSLPPHRCVLASCGSYRCFGTAAAVADENTAHFHPAERDDQPAYSHFFDRGHTPHFSSAFAQVQGAQENRAPTHQAAASTPGETLHDQYLKAYLSLDPKMRETHFHADTEGLNLATLQAMEVVEEARNSPLSETDHQIKAKWNQQVQNEIRSLRDAVSRHDDVQKKATKRKDMTTLSQGKRLMNKWFPKLKSEIEREQMRLALKKIPARLKPDGAYHIYIQKVDAEKLAVITMHALLTELVTKTGQVLLAKAALAVGRTVQMQYNLEMLRQKIKDENKDYRAHKRAIHKAQDRLLGILEEAGVDTRVYIDAFEAIEGPGAPGRNVWESSQVNPRTINSAMSREFGDEQESWPVVAVARMGTILLSHLLETAMIEVPQLPEPGRLGKRGGRGSKVETKLEHAFTHDVSWQNPARVPETRKGGTTGGPVRRYGVISAHPEVLKVMLDGTGVKDVTISRYFPMVIPPMPWIAFDTGGHLTLRCLVMRTRGDRAQLKLLQEVDKEMANGKPGMKQVYTALNALGSVGWQINKEVLAAVKAVWEGGGGLADIPSTIDVPLPPPLSHRYRLSYDGVQLLAAFGPPSYHEDRAWRNLFQKARKKNYELHSLRCDTKYKLEVAEELQDEPAIYFPHNVDFRGRAYPMHPYLNHLGADMCRGMLQFSDARPLGEKGLEWLYVQAANLYGASKMSLAQRKQFIADHLDDVVDSAESPLQGGRWWLGADEPWQCLAVCMDINRAIKSEDPVHYMSHLPVHQDGSCNGLQHYAALGRDSSGGRAVNLTDVDKPQDVYSGIAEMVAAKVAEDAANGLLPAKLLLGNVDRKLVKQTVMTSVYGVTFVGAREQIASRLRDRGWEDDRLIYQASKYGARMTMDKLHEMFQSAKYIMNWLADCARAVAASKQPVAWTTPMGLPVVQPYRRNDKQVVTTVLQRMVLKNHSEDTPIMKQRQRSAFPPNYIHSIDSTHMMMTAIACREMGLSFAGVHDSFWTHAGTIETMNSVLRKTFLELHSRPLLDELLEQLQTQYPEVEFPPIPPTGDLKLEEVSNAKYFFS
eukprot:jgi/Tetstr1/421493/TSEL_012441.t1